MYLVVEKFGKMYINCRYQICIYVRTYISFHRVTFLIVCVKFSLQGYIQESPEMRKYDSFAGSSATLVSLTILEMRTTSLFRNEDTSLFRNEDTLLFEEY